MPGRALETIHSARDQTLVNHMLDKHHRIEFPSQKEYQYLVLLQYTFFVIFILRLSWNKNNKTLYVSHSAFP